MGATKILTKFVLFFWVYGDQVQVWVPEFLGCNSDLVSVSGAELASDSAMDLAGALLRITPADTPTLQILMLLLEIFLPSKILTLPRFIFTSHMLASIFAKCFFLFFLLFVFLQMSLFCSIKP